MMRRFLIAILFLMAAFYSHSQTQFNDSLYSQQWYTQDYTETGLMGINLDSAMIIMAGHNPSPVIVAVLDAGVDITHADLRNRIWTNPNEIEANGIDDDGNGYVDDVHGWNFLGNDLGDNVKGDNLEVARLYRQYRERFGTKSPRLVSASDSLDYLLYLKIKQDYESRVETANNKIRLYSGLKETLDKSMKIVTKALKGQPLTFQNVSEIKSRKMKVKKAKAVVLRFYFGMNLSPDNLEHAINSERSNLDTKLNTMISPRDIVGDDELDINDSIYGNNDYNGGTASHGTSVAGIIAAEAGNAIGIAGICPSAKIMVLRVVPGGDEHDKDIALAIRYAVNQGAKVINCSFGKAYSPQKWMVDDAIRYAQDRGVLIVHAAGNDALDIDQFEHYPSKIDSRGLQFSNVLNVAASNSNSNETLVASFTNYGQTKVDFFAPGVKIMSTAPGNAYREGSGTSVAAPVVSGIAALLLSYYPQLTPDQVIQILHESASVPDPALKVKTPGTSDNIVPLSTLVVTPGVVNAYQALKLAERLSVD